MVDPLTTSVRAQVVKTEAQAPTKPAVATPAPVASTSAAEEVQLSTSAARLPKGMDVGPPFDLQTVKRIKEAIADGNYPINVEQISDALFENYRDMML